MAHISWNDAYSVHVQLIDDQHKYLLCLLDDIFDAIGRGETELRIGDIIERTVEHAALHFATEEHYFDLFKYEGSEDHKKRHRELTARAKEFERRYKEGETNIASEMVEFLEGWLIGHIMEADKKYEQCFVEHGLH